MRIILGVGVVMGDKLRMTDEEYDRICKGIIVGVALGTLVGVVRGNVTFYFALGGVSGIIVSTIYNIVRKYDKKRIHNSKLD